MSGVLWDWRLSQNGGHWITGTGDEEGVSIGLTWSTGNEPTIFGLTGGKAGRCTGGRDTGGPSRNGGDLGGRVGGQDSLGGF